MLIPWTEEERRILLRTRTVAELQYNEAMDLSAERPPWSQSENEAIASADQHLAVIKRAEREYFERLPREVMSCCPFCQQPLLRTFDRFGLDGMWWRSDALPEEPASCPHFCVLLGAVGFAGHQPESGNFEVSCGPEAPYVVPRLLRQPSVLAVVSSIHMKLGYTAYPIAYFAEERPAPQNLTAGWARNIYTYNAEDGRDEWRISNDDWDFDLRCWLLERRLLWCPPDSGNSFLSTDPPERCPFVDLPGRRARLVVYGNHLVERGLPDGASVYC